jgi:predicted DsbA family dithiol-disulfide isomerase
MPTPKSTLKITVFSDYICPFCYIGDARLNRLRDEYDLKVNWCFLEIHPETPAEGMHVSKLSYNDAVWRKMEVTLVDMAEEDGLPFHVYDFTTNSHSALLLAEAVKRNNAELFYNLHHRLFESLFVEGKNIGDRDVLRKIASDAGLAQELTEQSWEDPKYDNYLKQYNQAAQELEVRATPTLFIGEDSLRIDGSVPYDEMLKRIQAD